MIAHTDKDAKDDVKAGVKSTALHFGADLKPMLGMFALLSLILLGYAGAQTQAGLAFWIVSIGGAAMHYGWQMYTLKVDDISDCWQKFTVSLSICLPYR